MRAFCYSCSAGNISRPRASAIVSDPAAKWPTGIFLYSVGGLVLYGLGRERFRRMTRRRREGSPLERRAEEPSPVLAAEAAAGVTPPVHSSPEQEGSQAAG